MKSAIILLACLLVVGIPAIAQESQSTEVRVTEDAAGDIAYADATTAPTPQGSTDLRYLDISEDPDNIIFTLGTQPDSQLSDTAMNNLYFKHGDTEFRMQFQQRNLAGGWWWVYQLHSFEPSREEYAFIMQSEPLEFSSSEGWVTGPVPRSLLADGSGLLPAVGNTLEDIWVESRAFTVDAQFTDRMPDTGYAMTPYKFQLGDVHVGNIELWSVNPNRGSNGEATTFIFQASANNLGDEAIRGSFKATDVPDAWNVRFPAEIVELDPGETSTYPVLVTIPFAHQHGTIESVQVTLASESGDEGHLTLSVVFFDVPQPSGHHSRLWIHADVSSDGLADAQAASGNAVYDGMFMNAIEDPENDGNENVQARKSGDSFYWNIWLEPSLQLGLDFNLAETGTFHLPLDSDIPLSDLSIGGGVYLLTRNEAGGFDLMELAKIETSEKFTLDGPTAVDLVVRPTPDSDYVPFEDDAQLVIGVLATRDLPSAGTGPETPKIAPGGYVDLPLDEYHDEVDQVYTSLQGVALTANSPQQSLVNPGEAVDFEAELDYSGDLSTFEISLEGHGAEFAVLLSPSVVEIGPDSKQVVKVRVNAPTESIDDDVLDVLLVVQKKGDSSIQGLMRFTATVDTDSDYVDASLDDATQESPTAGFILTAGPMLALVLIRRKRME